MAENQVVDVPGVGEVEFPDSMDDAAILAAVQKLSAGKVPGGRVSAMEMGARSAATSGQPEEGPHEPDTWGGGFLKSIGDQISSVGPQLKESLEGAAHPQSMGDFLSLIIPNGVSEAGPAASRMMKAGVNEARTESGVKGTVSGFMRGMKKYAAPSDPHITMPGPGGFSSYQTSPTPRAGNFGPAMSEGVADITGQAGINELPAYLQQQMMEEAGSRAGAASGSARLADPPIHPTLKATPASPRLAGKAPTLEESLMQAMSQGAPDIDTRISNLPPSGDITAGGPLRQSGSFRKSESLGKPGGYSSGNPATTAETPTIEKELLQKLGGREGMAAPQAIDTTGWTKQDWADLRRVKGSRDAGKLTGKTADEIKELSGGGPSRTPLEAEERIRNYDPDKHLK